MLGTILSGQAEAQRKKVVVEMLKGPGVPRMRIVLMKSLARGGFEVISDKRLAAVEADLGLIKVSDNYQAIAREVKASAFVGGIMTGGRRPKARIVVRNADGKIIGASGWQATSYPKLLAAVNATATPKLAKIIGGAGAPAGGGRPAVAARTPAADEDILPAAPARKGKEAEEAAPAEAEEPAEEPAETAEAKEGEGGDADADAEVEAEAEAPRKRKVASKAGTGLNVAFVLRMFSRNFGYNESIKGGQQGYQAPEKKFNNLPLVPAPGIALEYFPVNYVGVFGSYNHGIAGSKDNPDPDSGREPSVYKTTAFSWMVGAKGRVGLGSMDLEPSIGYGSHVFKVDDFGEDANGIQVAPVDYKHVRLGGGVRLPTGFGSFTAGGHYLHILSAGGILSDDYFEGNAVGGELFAGVNVPLSFIKGLDFRAEIDFRRIAFAFEGGDPATAPRLAGGAVDQYIGLNLGIGYQLAGL
jgi:hypothetical protein